MEFTLRNREFDLLRRLVAREGKTISALVIEGYLKFYYEVEDEEDEEEEDNLVHRSASYSSGSIFGSISSPDSVSSPTTGFGSILTELPVTLPPNHRLSHIASDDVPEPVMWTRHPGHYHSNVGDSSMEVPSKSGQLNLLHFAARGWRTSSLEVVAMIRQTLKTTEGS
jgi:hypothetical protein